MRDSFYLAWQYLRRQKGTTAILVASLTLIFFLPAALVVVVDDATEHLRSRAVSTPLVVGSRGSPLELVLGTLYFDEPQPELMRMSQVERIEKLDLGQAIPLHAGTRTGKTVIVGTIAAYFRLRSLDVSHGRTSEILGECVVGSKAAQRLGLDVGSRLPVARPTAFALADAPLRLLVAGILAPTETADDEAIFVDLKTVWIIEGFGHGHATDAKHGRSTADQHTDVTRENENHFHFHGDESRYPITAIIIEPKDAKATALLLGQYLSPEDTTQIVRPSEVMDALLAKILMVRSYIISIVVLVSLVTLAVIALVIMLSIRLRRREIMTMTKMGCSRFAISTIIGSQIITILGIAASAALGLTLFAAAFGRELVRLLIL